MTAVVTSSLMPVPSSSRLPETPVKADALDCTFADSGSSSKKRKIVDAHYDKDEELSDDDEDLDGSSRSSSPSKPSHTGGRRKASDEERKARLEARQARNRLSAQYSRERKKAYVDQLEGSINALKLENASLRQQREQDQLLRQVTDARLRDSQIRVHTLETILRTVAPSLVPLLGLSSSSSPSLQSSSSSAIATSSPSSSTPQLDTGLSTNFTAALLQNNVPAADVFTQFDGVATPQVTASGRVGSNVNVNGSSIVKQEDPLASHIHVPAPEQPSSVAASSLLTLCQHPVEAKAAGVAREAEALLSNFIDLDAKLAHGDATTAPQDQGASTPTASSQPLPLGQVSAEAASSALRLANASAGDFASLSAASEGSGEVKSGSSSNNFEDGDSNIFSTISLSHTDSKHENPQERFQLLNSPILPTDRNMWELATDAMLQDIYSNGVDIADHSVPTGSVSDVSSSEVDVSASSSPFDLVDLDIEIEEPLHLSIGLDDENMADGAFLPKSDTAATMDWPDLMASLVA